MWMRLIVSMCQPMMKQQTRLKYQMQGLVRAQLLQRHVINLPLPLFRPLRPLFHSCPPLRTQSSLPCHPSFPLTPDLPCDLPMLNSSPPHTPPPLTTTHPWPCPIAPPRQLYPPLAFKHPTLSLCLLAQVMHNTQSPSTSSTLIHVSQATHPHDNDIEQGQRDQAEQPQDANAYVPPKRKSTCAVRPRRCGTSSHLVFQMLYFDFNFIYFSGFFVHEFVRL